jgi:hypothetical protein
MATPFLQEIDESCAPSRVRDIASVAVIDAESNRALHSPRAEQPDDDEAGGTDCLGRPWNMIADGEVELDARQQHGVRAHRYVLKGPA